MKMKRGKHNRLPLFILTTAIKLITQQSTAVYKLCG